MGGFFKLAPISVLQVIWLPLTLASGLYSTFRLLKQTTVPLIATMRADGLHLQWPQSRLNQLVSFGQISTYRVGTFGVANTLQLRLNDASKLTMANDPAAPTGQRLAELVPYFEKALQAYQPPTGTLAPRRVKGLLERLIASVVS